MEYIKYSIVHIVEILKYHIVPGERMSGVLQNGQQLFTLHGTTVNITKAASGKSY